MIAGVATRLVQVNFKARDDFDVVTVPDPETVKYRVHLDLATTAGGLGQLSRSR